jgi:hypothetical protein
VETALDNLERYLSIEEVPGFDVLAVEGITLDAPLELSHGIHLKPFDSLPESVTKEMFTQAPPNRFLGVPRPMAHSLAMYQAGAKCARRHLPVCPLSIRAERETWKAHACLLLLSMAPLRHR